MSCVVVVACEEILGHLLSLALFRGVIICTSITYICPLQTYIHYRRMSIEFIYLFVCLFIYLSIYLSVCLFIYLFVCLFIYLFNIIFTVS